MNLFERVKVSSQGKEHRRILTLAKWKIGKDKVNLFERKALNLAKWKHNLKLVYNILSNVVKKSKSDAGACSISRGRTK